MSNPPAIYTDFPDWTFLTNHAHVLICLAGDPQLRVREVAQRVGITERAVMRIIADLEAGGIIERSRVGRRNEYQIRADVPLRHPVERHRTVRELLAMVLEGRGEGERAEGGGETNP